MAYRYKSRKHELNGRDVPLINVGYNRPTRESKHDVIRKKDATIAELLDYINAIRTGGKCKNGLYPHLVHCNADHRQPIGCEMCICDKQAKDQALLLKDVEFFSRKVELANEVVEAVKQEEIADGLRDYEEANRKKILAVANYAAFQRVKQPVAAEAKPAKTWSWTWD